MFGYGLRCFAGVDEIAQLLGGLEVGHALGGDFDAFAGLGVAADARIALPDAEGAEAADLDLVAALQGGDDGFEDGLDDYFAIAAGEIAQAGHFFDQVGFCHIVRASAPSINRLWRVRAGKIKAGSEIFAFSINELKGKVAGNGCGAAVRARNHI